MATSTAAPNQLLEAAEKIADGAEVDWSSLDDALEPGLLACLRDVQRLAGGGELYEAAPSGSPLTSGSTFAHLQVIEQIGAGTSGIVYRAHDPVLARDVALKLCTSGARNPRALLREAQQMARVDHPNVLKVYGAAEQGGLVGFWCDLIQGDSLQSWSDAHPLLSGSELSAVGRELCAAAAAIHAVGMVHGDIKLSNVIRHASGRWVLVDFGSSGTVAEEYAATGTPLYMAPELLSGGRPTPQSDIYALGVVLFRLATRRFPKEADAFAQLLDIHRGGKSLRLLDLRSDLESSLVATIERAIDGDSKSRYTSMGQLAQSLGKSEPHRSPIRSIHVVGAIALTVLLVMGFLRWEGTGGGAPFSPLVEFERISQDGVTPVRNGDAIRPGDGLKMRYRNSTAAFVYVINEDAQGRSFMLFPLPSTDLANPLPANQELRLPGRVGLDEATWQVTSRGGEERFFIVVSESPLVELETTGLARAELLNGLTSEPLASHDSGLTRGTSGLRLQTSIEQQSSSLGSKVAALESQQGVHVYRLELRNP